VLRPIEHVTAPVNTSAASRLIAGSCVSSAKIHMMCTSISVFILLLKNMSNECVINTIIIVMCVVAVCVALCSCGGDGGWRRVVVDGADYYLLWRIMALYCAAHHRLVGPSLLSSCSFVDGYC
jgi:hypothetical protein